MRLMDLGFAAGIAMFATAAMAQGPYKVLQTAKTGGLGGFDYIYADDAGRRLYIPRGAVQGDNPTPARVTVFNLDTLAPVGEIPNVRANGAAVDAKSGHGFASSKPVAMWDTKTLAPIKTIDIDPKSSPDGILADPFNQRIYVFSHPTADATVIDAKDGAVLGTVDLGGAPEQGVSDGKGHIYVVIQDKANVAVIDAKTMKVTAHYDLEDKGSRCNGLALDAKNHVLFAACGQSGIPAVTPAQPMMVILSADDGKIGSEREFVKCPIWRGLERLRPAEGRRLARQSLSSEPQIQRWRPVLRGRTFHASSRSRKEPSHPIHSKWVGTPARLIA